MRIFSEPGSERQLRRLRCWLLSLAVVATPRALHAAEKSLQPAVRWQEGLPGSTFSRTTDGRYVYGLWCADIGITVSIDAQELQKVHRRHEPFFSALVSVRYRGHSALDFTTENISLEFVNHFKVVQTSLDPDAFAEKVQNDADTVDHEAARTIEKHPEEKEKKEAYVRAFQKDAAELLEFIGKNSLRNTRLDSGRPETSGWVLFGTNSKWLGKWKKQEELILRIPIQGTVYEFPFLLPPKPGEVVLRKRD